MSAYSNSKWQQGNILLHHALFLCNKITFGAFPSNLMYTEREDYLLAKPFIKTVSEKPKSI
jgi:hypothetical protein